MENPDMVAYANAQPVPMTTANILGQNLQALTQILDSQQQMLDHQQDWLRHSLVSFKIPKITKDDDPEAYIKAFERHALMTGLNQEYWANQLGALVVGKAQAAYRALPRDEARDYECMKQTILYQLEISPDHYRCLFRSKKGSDERRPRVLLQLLRDLLNKWVSPPGSDREDLADQVVLEQFQNDLEERTQHWVRQHFPQNCEEVLELVKAFAAAKASYPRERRSPGPALVLPKEPEWRHPPTWGATRDTVCFRCRQSGHFSQECPSQPEHWISANRPRGFTDWRRSLETSEPMDCSYAGGEGNATWGHPVIKAWVDGRPVQATLDSGCAQSMIRADMVCRQAGRKAPLVTVACLHGEA
ncbi:hypothetical protein Y1Q_0021408 [Alligator mississippiensis]|uniref:CCHC-type domain-containing protein n=1 Tax=Alligator mississippiensis TaxID=8496 RepID=A0A151P9N8_ALLMI|nr:hypothetical protein Y1Q_0021408 [Alligator mississippiensis]